MRIHCICQTDVTIEFITECMRFEILMQVSMGPVWDCDVTVHDTQYDFQHEDENLGV